MIDAYLYQSCSSCRKAEAVLKDAGVAYQRHEYFKTRLSAQEIATLCERIGVRPSELVSTRSTPYKEGKLADMTLTDEEWTHLMAEEPRLIRRPIIVCGQKAVIGFDEEKIRTLIGAVS